MAGEQTLQPLLETLEAGSASQTEQTDAYLTLANRLSGEEGKEFTAVVGKQFPRVCKLFKKHIIIENSDLSNAALQALGFCVFNSKIASGISVSEIRELLTTLNSIATKSSDKNTCTRALWVIAKQCFPSEEVGKMVPDILSTLETVLNRGDVQSMVIEYEALNIVIRLLEQTPVQMGEEAGRWAKLIVPLVVHSAPRVRLRGATALEMGMPLLLRKQQDVAAITEPLMSTKIISELQRLFSTKNETYVLKLWPLFVKLLGKTLHRSGSFINSLLQLEELGFRSGSPVIKKIAFIAWKSLIDNFALNPEILASSKRLKLLMQPLCSIHVRTETLALTKLEVWWYLLIRLGPQLSANFEQVCTPLIQNALSVDATSAVPGTPASRSANQSLTQMTPGTKSGNFSYVSPTTPRMNLNSSSLASAALPSIQLLGLEMLLHFLLGPEVGAFATKHNLVLGLEPLQHPLISNPSFFCKHASTLMNAVQDGFIAVGKDASDAILQVIWKEMISLVKAAIEAGNKRDRQGSDVLPLLLQALKNIVIADALPAQKTLALIESTIKGLPQKALGSPAYQVANMDLLNGTPALFLIQLLFHDGLLEHCEVEERFFICLETLVNCVLSGPTSPLAFSESVLGVLGQNAKLLENKEHLWRMWSIIVNPLTERITQTNEVNQGDALEHNFSALHIALTLPVNHLFPAKGFPQPTMKSLLRTWSELYKAFARCAALVTTTEENVCCEELGAKILSGLGEETLTFSTLDGIVQSLLVMVESINFSPYSTKYLPKVKAPQTPTDWAKKKHEPLGNLTSLLKLVVKLIDSFHTLACKELTPEIPTSAFVSVGCNILGILTTIISHISLTSIIKKLFQFLTKPLAVFYEKTSKSSDVPKAYSSLSNKLEKLLGEIFLCLQSRYSGAYDSELLSELTPLLSVVFLHKNKQIRNQMSQFWNATFAKTTVLVYPAELKTVLSQVRQKTPIILPGFESVEVEEVSSGPYSDPNENFQMDTKISGMEVKSSGKRDSILAQSEDRKENGTPKRSKQAKLKLEFSSPKVKTSDKFLEEERTMDFVFIPPETKQRVLTEHQKEVLKTKRVIPTMYNNLDASQDAILFSQYTQSQEDSLEKPAEVQIEAGTEKQTKAEAKESREQKMETATVAEKGEMKYLSEDGHLNESINKAHPGDVSIGENTSAGSNCSTSDMVSDTPPQPVSRRQSFITLEKFDPSGSKHFSPATLSTQSGTLPVSVLNQLEVKDSPENQENPAEKCGVGIKNFSESKAEKTAFKARHTSKQMQIKESNQGANKDVAENSGGIVASEECKFNEHHVQPEDTQCIPDTQVAESSLMLTEEKVKQAERDNETEADIESKENKPPGGESFDLKHNQVTLDQNINSNQKSLRRSSRRRLEISEFGNTDKEKSDHNKKDKNVEDEKPVQKESQTKNEDLQGYKTLSEKLDEYENVGYSKQGNENSVLNNINKQEALPEEVIPSSKESLRDCKPEVSTAQDSASDKAVEEKTTHPRYKTRRASLVTLAGTENSESDSSESREEITNKKGTMRAKPKTSTSGFKDEQFQSLEISTSRILAEKEPSTNMETRIASSTETDMEVTIITQSSVVKDKCKTDYSSVEECSGLKDTGTMLIKQDTSKDGHITNVIGSTYSELCTSEPAVQSAQSNKTYDVQSSIEASTKTESLLTEPMLGDFSTASSDVFAQTDSSLSDIECRHKRSKRLRKSKGCDCCTGQLQEKTVVESKGSEKRILKLDDKAKKTKLTHLSAEEESCVDEEFDDTVFVGPSAMSTPLLTNKKPRFFKASAIERKSTADSEEENTVVHQNATSVDTDQTTETLKTNKHLNSLLPEKPGLNSKMCESCPVAELDSNIPPQRDCTPLVCECDQLASVVQCNKVETQGPVEGVAEVIGENARKTKAQELIPEHGQNKKISSSTPFETSLSTSDEIKGPMPATEAESDSAVFDSVTIADEAIEGIAIPGEQTVQTIVTLVEQPMVGIADSREQATARTITSGEPAAVAKSANGEQAALDIATSGEHSVVPNTVEQAVVDIPTSGDSGEQIFTSEESVVMDIACPGEPALVALNNVGSPPKFKGLEGAALVSLNGSPGEVQSRCIWSPSASPSTSILKKGLKRPQEDDSPSPINKIRRVSFADPIYKEELADDIDRRSPVVRNGSSSSSSSPTTKSLKMSPNVQNKLMTTPTKGFISSGSRLGPKSSKKCLITEMAKESLPSPRESVYPALVNCTTPVDVILPQITSNMWARGLGQLIRAKNIKTVGDLSALTISEIKTLPIRSPKISTVKKALRMIHEQQMKSRGYEEIVPLEEVDKQVNGLDEIASSATEDERLSPVLPEPPSTLVDANPSIDVMAKIDALAVQLTPEELCHYSASRLFEMHEKLTGMTSCLMRSLQARWTSPPHKSST